MVLTEITVQKGNPMQKAKFYALLLLISLFPAVATAGPGGPDGDEIIFRSAREVQLFTELVQNQTVRNRLASLSRRYALTKVATQFQVLPSQARGGFGSTASYYCSFNFALRGSKSKWRRRVTYRVQAGIDGPLGPFTVNEKNIRQNRNRTASTVTARTQTELFGLIDAFSNSLFTDELSNLLRHTRIEQISFSEVRSRTSQTFTIRIFHRKRPSQVINQTVWYGRYANRGTDFRLIRSIGK